MFPIYVNKDAKIIFHESWMWFLNEYEQPSLPICCGKKFLLNLKIYSRVCLFFKWNYKSRACNFKKDKWKFPPKILIMFWEDIPVTSVYKV